MSVTYARVTAAEAARVVGAGRSYKLPGQRRPVDVLLSSSINGAPAPVVYRLRRIMPLPALPPGRAAPVTLQATGFGVLFRPVPGQ